MGSQAEFLAMKARILDVTPRLLKATAPQLEGWDDAKLAQIRERLGFRAYVHSRAHLKVILVRFYNLYFKGIIKETDFVSSIVFDVVAITETEGGRIWTQENDGKFRFYPANTSQEDQLSDLTIWILPGVAILNPNWTEADRAAYQKLMSVYTGDSQRMFHKLVADVIGRMSISGPPLAEERSLIILSSFLALTLLRAATKNKEQLGNAFLKSQYKVNLASLAQWEPGKPFAPPCSRCLELCEHALRKGSNTTGSIFAIISHEFAVASRGGYRDPHVVGFLSASVLTHTARNGLGMLQLLDHVCDTTGKEWMEVFEMTSWTMTKAAWNGLITFFNSQCLKRDPQYSYNWARIVDHGYFRGLSPKENPFLATVSAAILGQTQGPGVWNAEWAKLHSDISAAKEVGLAIYRMTRPSLEGLEGGELATHVVNLAKQERRAYQDRNGNLFTNLVVF